MDIESDELMQKITGQIFIGHGILIAYKLGLFKMLSEKPFALSEISLLLKLSHRAALSLIASAGALNFIESCGDKFKLTAIGAKYLDPNSVYYYGSVLDLLISQSDIMTYDRIKNSILTDKPQVAGGVDIFSNESGIGGTREFIQAVHQKAMPSAFYWVKQLDLTIHNTFIDLGGGSGIHTIASCMNNSNLFGIVCDRKPVLIHTKNYIKDYNLVDRIRVKELDIWKDIFPQGDVYFLGDIFHDWPKRKCLLLAKKCYDALPTGGKIILHEMLFNENKTGPFLTSAYHLKMMLWTEGQQYTFLELESILEEVGFSKIGLVKSVGNWSLVVGHKN